MQLQRLHRCLGHRAISSTVPVPAVWSPPRLQAPCYFPLSQASPRVCHPSWSSLEEDDEVEFGIQESSWGTTLDRMGASNQLQWQSATPWSGFLYLHLSHWELGRVCRCVTVPIGEADPERADGWGCLPATLYSMGSKPFLAAHVHVHHTPSPQHLGIAQPQAAPTCCPKAPAAFTIKGGQADKLHGSHRGAWPTLSGPGGFNQG